MSECMHGREKQSQIQQRESAAADSEGEWTETHAWECKHLLETEEEKKSPLQMALERDAALRTP